MFIFRLPHCLKASFVLRDVIPLIELTHYNVLMINLLLPNWIILHNDAMHAQQNCTLMFFITLKQTLKPKLKLTKTV